MSDVAKMLKCIHASDQIRIMAGDLADSATLGGAVALSSFKFQVVLAPLPVHGYAKATTNYLAAYKQRWHTRGLTTVMYILCIFHWIQMHMREQMELFAAATEQEMSILHLIPQGILDSENFLRAELWHELGLLIRVADFVEAMVSFDLSGNNTTTPCSKLLRKL